MHKRAFTLIELLVVIAVLALLLTLRISAFAKNKDQSLRAQCSAHLRQLALATTIIANDNADQLPTNSVGYWPWDMSWNVGNTFTNYMSLQTLYCPASGFTPGGNNRLWTYVPGSYHIIGYAQTFPGPASVFYTNVNSTLTPQRIPLTGLPLTIVLPAPIASQRVLFADSTISAPGQNNPAQVSQYQWGNLPGGLGPNSPFRTDHLDGALPAGGNLAMLDGHVEWRSFPKMVPRSVNSVSGVTIPVWWW
jgi:prepilin-type N-terminal cleavage/methylation domain-containing protein/prepilin-type processing-associated H-X9-DG protein